MKPIDVLQSVKEELLAAGIAESEAKAKVIVSHALGIALPDIFLDNTVSDGDLGKIDQMTQRCQCGEPVEHITGKAYFRYAELDVSADVLIPRKETELVAQQAINLIQQKRYKRVLDMCTGSGCIAISLAMETAAQISACDISEAALALAKRNAARNNVSDKTSFFISDMFSGVHKTFDLIVSNPPYISEQEYAALDNSVLDYEPKLALLAGDGLRFYRNIAKNALQYLSPGGALVLEIGASQAKSVLALLKQSGMKSVQYKKDYQGRDRIIIARKQ